MVTTSSKQQSQSKALALSSMIGLAGLFLASLATPAESHGHLVSPRSRNWVAHKDGVEPHAAKLGTPKAEYCPQCLKGNNGVCGVGTHDYDQWVDSTGVAMPWVSEGTYQEGEIVEFTSKITAHHYGHLELKACPMGRQADQDCFEQHPLTFEEDVLFGMPKDPAHPERGYLSGGVNSGIDTYKMKFKLPADVVGSSVLIQWKYITANSCSPPGYSDYFGGANSDSKALPDEYWNQAVATCKVPYPQDGTTGEGWPEQFFNCAEVSIMEPDSAPSTVAPTSTRTASPTTAPVTEQPTSSSKTGEPTKAPVTSPTSPAPTLSPTDADDTPTTSPSSGCCSHDYKTCVTWCGNSEATCGRCDPSGQFKWLAGGALPHDQCTARWEECTNSPSSCCPGLVCKEGTQWYSQCEPLPASPSTPVPTAKSTAKRSVLPTAKTTPMPTSTLSLVPTAAPTTSPTSAPTGGLRGTSRPTDSPTAAPTNRPTSLTTGSSPGHGAAQAVEDVLDASKDRINNELLIYETPQSTWEPSSVYRFDGLLAGLRLMYEDGVASAFFYVGDDDAANGHEYGLVNIAAFLAQSMKETIRYDACDENSWDLVNGKYPLSNACGQLGQSYQDYHCSEEEKHMECPVDLDMEITATTNAKWWGAPGPLKCGPKSKYPFTGFWDHSLECNKPWASPPETCDAYEGQKAGGENNNAPVANVGGRTDVEGCCWWGRGVIQTTGVCNFGKLNYFLGKRAADEGRKSRYPTIDFCKEPDAICASQEFQELKWIAGMFYWINSLQTYNVGGWNYMTELRNFVDGGMTNDNFINAVSGIVNRGCHNPPCATGSLDGGPERVENFHRALDVLGLRN